MSAVSESRGNRFIAHVNANIPERDRKVSKGDFEVALGLVSLVAATDETTFPNMYDRAYEVAAHLNGSSLPEIMKDPTLNHLPYGYSPQDRDNSIRAVAARAAVLIQMESSSPASRVPTPEEILGLSISIHDTVIALHEQGRISEPMAKGMLVVFEEVDVTKIDNGVVQRITDYTYTSLRRQMSGRRHQYPFINRVVGSDADGLEPNTVMDLAQAQQTGSADINKAITYVKTRIAQELQDLYTPRVY